jgi:hypothetical protein
MAIEIVDLSICPWSYFEVELWAFNGFIKGFTVSMAKNNGQK